MKNLLPHLYYIESLQHGWLIKRLAELLLLLLGGVSWAAAQQTNQSRKSASLEEVADIDHEVTGVAVAMDGRIFVNFPRWTEDTEISVAKVGSDGKLMPYPDAGWNVWRNNGNLSPEAHLVCVQSVVADRYGNLWILDPGAPAIGTIVQGAPKLLQVDLATTRSSPLTKLLSATMEQMYVRTKQSCRRAVYRKGQAGQGAGVEEPLRQHGDWLEKRPRLHQL